MASESAPAPPTWTYVPLVEKLDAIRAEKKSNKKATQRLRHRTLKRQETQRRAELQLLQLYTKAEAEKAFDAYLSTDSWLHLIRVKLRDGSIVTTPGSLPLLPKTFGLDTNLKGKVVLDVGAADGFWTHECLVRGAEYVHAIDDFSLVQKVGHIPYDRSRKFEKLDLVCALAGFDADKWGVEEISIEAYPAHKRKKSPEKFDVILLFDVLTEVENINQVLRVCASLLKPDGKVLFSDRTIDKIGVFEKIGYGDRPILEYYDPLVCLDQPSIWGFTLAAVVSMAHGAGLHYADGYNIAENVEEQYAYQMARSCAVFTLPGAMKGVKLPRVKDPSFKNLVNEGLKDQMEQKMSLYLSSVDPSRVPPLKPIPGTVPESAFVKSPASDVVFKTEEEEQP